jgi:hypothetical protein
MEGKMMIRRACALCHIAIDGLGVITDKQVSHGICDSCGNELYDDLWDRRVGTTRWSGKRLATARARAHHGLRWTAKHLGVAHSTIARAEKREILTPYVQKKLCDAYALYGYYVGLTS